MLKNIPAILSPDLLRALCAMGHTDEILLADGNFAAESIGKNAVVIRADGHSVPALLEAILALFPLDDYVPCPVSLMELPKGMEQPAVWGQYKQLLAAQGVGEDRLQTVAYDDFYAQARRAAVIVATGETALYANIILRKGIVA